MGKPNIVFIFSDQHRGDAIGCTGHPTIQTPCLDQIASEGVGFTQCYANGPLCMPSRSTMMTGQYVREHGVWNNDFDPDLENSPSHVRNVKDAGYHTAQVGKTGIGKSDKKRVGDMDWILNAWGFNDTCKLPGVHGSRSGLNPYSEYLAEKGLLDVHQDYMKASKARKEAGQAEPWTHLPSPLPSEDHLDTFAGRTAAEWIRDYKGDQPFYLQVLFPGPHDPFDAPLEYRKMYNLEDMPEGIMVSPNEPHPPYIKRYIYRSNMMDMTVAQKKQLLVNYYSKITLIDAAISGIYDALKKKKQLDNTWIIYSSDHGEMAGDHRLGYKGVFYDASVRVPLIVRPPGGIDAWRSDALTDVLDIVASMLDISGAEGLEESDGYSWVDKVTAGPQAEGAQEGKEVVFSEVAGYTMIFEGSYKLVVEAQSEEPVELYDMENDPDELQNLAEDPGLESMRQKFD